MRKIMLWRMLVAGFLGVVSLTGILSTPLLSTVLVDRLQTFPPISSVELAEAASARATAIVILSAGRRSYAPEFGGETLDELSLERLRYGARLARKTGLPVLVSGGRGIEETTSPLAELLADALLQDYGIRAQWLETQSRNTAENAINSSTILKAAGVTRVILVTHAWHMPRARAAFIANGVSVLSAPTAFYRPNYTMGFWWFVPSINSLQMTSYALHENLGSIWYAVRYGYRRAPAAINHDPQAR